MQGKKVGTQSIAFGDPPVLTNTFSIVGPMEGAGPLGDEFNTVLTDTYYGEKTWEKAESKMLKEALFNVCNLASLKPPDIDYVAAGDLLNQIVSANFALRDFPTSFLGLYGACSTLAEAMTVGSILIDGGYGKRVIAATCSHHDTAERQYRFPTELGTQRKMTAQWTVTGAGAVLLQSEGDGPRATCATIGKVVDKGIKDPNDMGAAMAPAAADTLVQHFRDFAKSPQDYDLIVTGDLGRVGLDIARELLAKEGFEAGDRFSDCGVLIYDKKQDIHSGASGCGCSAVVFSAHLYRLLRERKIRKLLLAATGALLSPLTYQQAESIPGICHAIAIEVY